MLLWCYFSFVGLLLLLGYELHWFDVVGFAWLVCWCRCLCFAVFMVVSLVVVVVFRVWRLFSWWVVNSVEHCLYSDVVVVYLVYCCFGLCDCVYCPLAMFDCGLRLLLLFGEYLLRLVVCGCVVIVINLCCRHLLFAIDCG